MIGLYVGRFQPFHLGHYKVILNIENKVDTLIIGIGSSQYKNTKKNPFSFGQRKNMIERTFKDKKEILDKIKIVSIPDLHNECIWAEHVISIVGHIDILFTNDGWLKRLFADKNIKVQDIPFFDRKKYSGSNVRDKISKNKNWKSLVSKATAEVIEEIND